MRNKRDIEIRCELCGRLYNEGETKGRVSINEYKKCDCGNHDDSKFLAANTCPVCINKIYDFVTSLIKGDK